MVKEEKWLSSKEVKKILKVSDCELSHLRNDGKLVFMKKGNAFLYSLLYIESLKLNKKT
ncbi:MAG: helix-turn-helix domain-containing protein [Methylococcaceae bacterium]|nr:helix-turn-helix domain-containing protein [Methylococcaceae bacterium]